MAKSIKDLLSKKSGNFAGMEIKKDVKDEILKLHSEIENQMIDTLGKACRIGQLLDEQKKSLKHGSFIPWIQNNLSFDERMAQKYISIYANRKEIQDQLDANTKRISYLGINKLISFIDVNRNIVKNNFNSHIQKINIYINKYYRSYMFRIQDKKKDNKYDITAANINNVISEIKEVLKKYSIDT